MTKEQKDKVWKRNEIDSPCIQVCVVHPSERICTGCFRTIDEIAQWSKMPSEQRDEIMTQLDSRAARLKKRRGGRSARLAQNKIS
jgi:predicted Fe-S protein YdhL (DUF1289 family)